MVLLPRLPVLLLAGVVPVVLRPEAATAWLWIALVAVLVLVDVVLAGSPAALLLEREAVGRVRLGESTRSRLRVTNPGRRHARGLLRDAWRPSAGAVGNRHRLDVPPGERRVYETALTPTRRGDRPADLVTLRRRGPLGVAGRQASRPVPGSVRALPPFTSRRHLPGRLARLRELDGRSAVRVRGQGTEFDSLREYVRGDDVRSIDWRATARRRQTVVRTWQPERDRRVVLVLDTSRTSAARVADVPRLDTSLDAALLLAALAERAGDRVDLVAGDQRVRLRHRQSGRTGLVAGLVEAMAPLQPRLVEARWPALVGAVAELTRQRALVVLLTSLEPAAVTEGLLPVLPALTARHRVVLASVRDPALGELRAERGTLAAAYDAAAAEQVLAGRAHLARVLGRLGVSVVDAPPDDLPLALTDHYLELKARGLL